MVCRLCKASHNITSLEAQANDFMVGYDKRKEEIEKHKQRLQKPDEDGWITITRKNPKPVQGKRHRQKKKKELLNFYQFQLRESKLQNCVENLKKTNKRLRKSVKSKRKFRPY